MGLLLFDLLPELFNWIVVRRIGRQLDDLQPCCLLGEEGLRLSAGVILRPILNEDNGLGGLLQNAREKGNVGSGVEAPVLTWAWAALSSLTTASVAPPLDARHGIFLEPVL